MPNYIKGAEMKYIDIHTHRFDLSEDSMSVVNLFPEEKPSGEAGNVFYSVGLHPWHVREGALGAALEKIEKLLAFEKVIAIGEIGLDKACGVPFELQERAFRTQLDIAGTLEMPVIIHCVRAYPEILRIRKEIKKATPWIIHGFQGNIQTARQLMEKGIRLSFGAVLKKTEHKASSVFKEIPDDAFFLESDESGSDIRDIYALAAEMRENNINELKSQLAQNFVACFGDKIL